MKVTKLFLTILFLAALTLPGFALVSKCKGYYIGVLNDSVACEFDIPIDRSVKTPIYLELQKRVICTVAGRKQNLSPKKVTKFVFEFDSSKVEMCSIPFGRKDARIFAKKQTSGYLTIYDYYTESEARPQSGYSYYGAYGGGYGNGMYSVRTGIYQNFLMLKSGETKFVLIDGLNFKAAMSGYFSDYPELADKIKKGEYTKKMIRTIGDEYNLKKGNP